MHSPENTVDAANDHLYVIGSSTPLAPALAAQFGPSNTTFLGRTNPHRLDNWAESPSLETDEGIYQTQQLLSELAGDQQSERSHLVLLQGVSSRDWQASIHVNMLSVGILTEEFCKQNRRNATIGSVAMLGSASAYLGSKLPYSATKAALTGIMNGINKEYGSETRANLIVPGAFEGGMTTDWDTDKRVNVSERTYAGRLATASEIADAIMFCAKNDYVCGSVINMTSGQVDIQ
jgi:NAD(P)-dependent dehydrogenase (short-subunit alcohol dehydrogenase family)